ncbi:WhiB family transcriptional regulator [Amycolatopsis sp. DSM 110486]|uniref:WhiB family transcriptional regulator n=1 Tax=Amycolatopsis sp. DSM 110486 TaxID=2865832 RepID=UPI001C6A4CAF|nr:WhiB family transcriptional regulator [Amycolatopsis sp. DSM 110486]
MGKPALSLDRDAACSDEDPELFFAGIDSDAEAEAKAVCARCPVQDLCLEEANSLDVPPGVWGGLNYRERRNGHAPYQASWPLVNRIARLTAAGWTAREIAQEVEVAERTVQRHRAKARGKATA